MVTCSRFDEMADTGQRDWVRAGHLDDLWEGEMRSVGLGPVTVVVCNVEGEVFAYADRCPHLGSRLSEGTFDGRRITCAAHEWVFEARGGAGVNPSEADLDRYPVCVVDDAIFIDRAGMKP